MCGKSPVPKISYRNYVNKGMHRVWTGKHYIWLCTECRKKYLNMRLKVNI